MHVYDGLLSYMRLHDLHSLRLRTILNNDDFCALWGLSCLWVYTHVLLDFIFDLLIASLSSTYLSSICINVLCSQRVLCRVVQYSVWYYFHRNKTTCHHVNDQNTCTTWNANKATRPQREWECRARRRHSGASGRDWLAWNWCMNDSAHQSASVHTQVTTLQCLKQRHWCCTL